MSTLSNSVGLILTLKEIENIHEAANTYGSPHKKPQFLLKREPDNGIGQAITLYIYDDDSRKSGVFQDVTDYDAW